MQVIEDEHKRPLARRAPEEGRGRVEETEARPFGIQRGRGGKVRDELAHLGDDLGDGRRPRPELPEERLAVAAPHVRAEGLHPGPVRGSPSCLPAAADEDLRAEPPGAIRQLVGEATLPDAGLSADENKLPVPGKRALEAVEECRELAITADEDAPARSRAPLPVLPPGPLLRSGCLQRGVLRQHRLLQTLQHRARLEPELLGERAARLLVGGKGFGLSARSIEREHQLGAQALPERVANDERLKLAHELGVPA